MVIYIALFLVLLPWHAFAFHKLKPRPERNLYEEDLAPHRIVFSKVAATPMPLGDLVLPYDQTKSLALLLAKRKQAYAQADSIRGYTIQLYMGDRKACAFQAMDWVSTFTSQRPQLHYRQPYYTVRLGFFFDSLEAYLVYLSLVKNLLPKQKAVFSLIIRPLVLKKAAYLAYQAADAD